MSFIAGRYTATWNNLALGQHSDGIRVSHQHFKRLIVGDNFGDGPQDAIYRGSEFFVSGTLMEANAAAMPSLAWPYGNIYEAGEPGRMDVAGSFVKSLVLTAITGTPAASTPATLTCTRAIIAENFPIEILFGPDLREIPYRMRCYRSADSTPVFASQT